MCCGNARTRILFDLLKGIGSLFLSFVLSRPLFDCGVNNSYLTDVTGTPTLWLVMEYVTGFALNEIIDVSRKARQYLLTAANIALITREVSMCDIVYPLVAILIHVSGG